MGIKRWRATKDNTITNAFESNLVTRGTGSNMGLADSLEVFSIFGQASSASIELTRFLVQFPVTLEDSSVSSIAASRAEGDIPASGSVSFYLRLFNVAHDQTTPRDFTLVAQPISQSWQEGYGLDMENYSDQTYNGTGSNWINAAAGTPWTSPGGDFLSSPAYQQVFDVGTGDLSIDITEMVENWLTGTAGGEYANNGVGIHLTSSQENGNRSYYTKKFSARDSEYFFKRPIIEARWDSTRKDQRGNFFVSSSARSAADNINTIYFYNYYRNQLVDLPTIGTGAIYVRNYISASTGSELPAAPNNPITGGWVSTGIYSASFALDTTEEVVYDRWFNAAETVCYYTGSYKPKALTASPTFQTAEYISAMTNLQCEFYNEDVYDFRLYTRLKNWNPTIYTVAIAGIQKDILDNIYYSVYRTVDDLQVVSYGTGSENHTRLSYDVSGSYFTFDMSMLEVGFEYGIRLLFSLGGNYIEDENTYKFKIIE